MRRILLLLAIIAPILALTAPAKAGGWAVTYLDPAPAAIQPDMSYTIGSWVLQHGSHPYWGSESDLKVGLRFTDGRRTLDFTAVELREPAHYATAVAVPAGTWQVIGVQDWFAPFPLGTLTVPGTLRLNPPAPEHVEAAAAYLSANNGKDPWGTIRPAALPTRPGTAQQPSTTPSSVAVASTPSPNLPAAAPLAAISPDRTAPWWRQPYTLVGLVVIATAAILTVRLRQIRRRS